MAIEIIPDKICPHCGGNKWTIVIRKDRPNPTYLCTERINNNSRKYNKLSVDSRKLKYQERVAANYYNTSEYREQQKKLRKTHIINLSDLYIKSCIASSTNIKFKDVTIEQVIKKREEIIRHRNSRRVSALIRRRKSRNRSYRKASRILSNRYVKSIIRGTLNFYKLPHLSEYFSDEAIIHFRERIKSKRDLQKYNSDCYIINVIRAGDRYYGIKTKRENISQQEIDDYRELLIAKHKFKERIKQEQLIKNEQL